MSTTYDSTVNAFYVAFYGRPADPAGLAYWSQQLAQAGGDFSVIKDAFANSEEATVRFSSTTATDRITEIYQQLFNRAPEAAGLSYWVDAVSKGHATMADVAIDVLQGAQGSDASLVNLRQKAAAEFTAHVAATGTSYDGYQAVQAGQLLVRSVNSTTTSTDIDNMITAASSLASTAKDAPSVIDSLAGSGESLADLADTQQGKTDPVTLLQALADAAKQGATDPASMAQLLRGGGMGQVLKTMPPGTSLPDLIKALDSGGMPAATDLVYRGHAPQGGDTTAPTVASIAYGDNDGSLAVGDKVTFSVKFSEAVQTKGQPHLLLNNEGVAHYVSGSGTDTLVFSYTVGDDDHSTTDLATAVAHALGGSIRDLAGNALVATGADNVNPDGTLAVVAQPATTDGGTSDSTLKIVADAAGVHVSGVTAGDISLVDPVTKTATHVGTISDGQATLGEQAQVVSGTVSVTTSTTTTTGTTGTTVTDSSATVYTLGTASGDTVSGTHVWGFGGNDTITGTTGVDTISGGAGADHIDLGADQAVDVLLYGKGDTDTHVFTDGGSISAMDVIVNAGLNDVIQVAEDTFTGTATGHTTYLADATANNYAIVQGSDIGGVFKAGTATTDDDYMIQWSDGTSVNSVVLENVGTTAPTLHVDPATGTITLAAASAVAVVGIADPVHG
ncbi:DUF4214 domain-containing protein [Massilia rhizosphaerae]|uniref:DUF4214 domain-containing protein n=1 Tax=Massilia rhizosphaerae TaxID=2784389 RepID=UPI0018DD4FD3|nr:DUF4214 domain-containing protein [Massilia rhizosphaerae]